MCNLYIAELYLLIKNEIMTMSGECMELESLMVIKIQIVEKRNAIETAKYKNEDF